MLESQFGVGHDEMSGRFAAALWRDYETAGSKSALKTLLSYNSKDVENIAFFADQIARFTMEASRQPDV